MKRRLLLLAMVLAPLLLLGVLWLIFLLGRQGGLAPFRVPQSGSRSVSTEAAVLERGRYLATLGNCAGCHTARDGEAYAGGRAFRTGYGTVYSSNLTPDPAHGIGGWSREEFAHAMRHGVSRNGVQSPVFPYASFRHLSDADLDALFAYLGTLPAVSRERRDNAFEFPATIPGAMTAWRLLYYRPTPFAASADTSLEARGAYLVSGIGHCATCHGARGTFASQSSGSDLLGARNAGWHAPALHRTSLQRFEAGTLADYLRGGTASGFAAYGYMADVIAGNLQHLRPDDADAIEAYLRTLPAPRVPATAAPQPSRIASENLAHGERVYRDQCADCHGARGEGEPGKYPRLHDSSAVVAADPINLIKVVMFGAVAPTTALNPAPYSMPPFAQSLSTDDVAAVANYLRLQADRGADPVTADEVRAVGGID